MTARSGTTFGKGNLFMIQKIYYTFFFFPSSSKWKKFT